MYGISGFFILIGVLMLLFKIYIFAIIFIPFSICGFIVAKKQINEKAKEYEKKGKDSTINSIDELKDVSKEMTSVIKDGLKESSEEVLNQLLK